MFKSPGSDTYVIFGDAHIEDLSQNAMSKASAAAAARTVRSMLFSAFPIDDRRWSLVFKSIFSRMVVVSTLE